MRSGLIRRPDSTSAALHDAEENLRNLNTIYTTTILTRTGPVTKEALRRIALLYAIEQQGRGMTPEQRFELRQQHAVPALAELHAWLLATQPGVAAGSGTAKAIDHALKRWAALKRYIASGILPIDNNPIENAIRPIAIGKKYWLFAGSARAGRRAAAIQSLLLAAAKLNGLDPARWLADTLERLPTCPNSKIDSLLPFGNSTGV